MQGTAQRHTYGKSGRCEDGQERAGIDAEDTDNNDNQYQHEYDTNQAQQKGSQREFDIAANKGFGDKAVNAVDYPFANEEDRQSNGNLDQSMQNGVDGLFRELLEREGRQGRELLLPGLCHLFGSRQFGGLSQQCK